MTPSSPVTLRWHHVGVPPRRRIAPADGADALEVCRAAGPGAAPREALAAAVRFALEELGARAPGRSVEVRVPPFGAVQCVAGPVHRRGTPSSVVETDPGTWLAVVTGELAWTQAVADGRVVASGERAALDRLLPLWSHDAPG